jgi:hypothetical protein
MTSERHVSERNRLQLERARDALFETRMILAELERDNSISLAQRRALRQGIETLEAQLQSSTLEDAFSLRDRARDFYAPRMAA